MQMRLIWPRRKAPQPSPDWAGPQSFADWTMDEIDAVSAAIRQHGQPDSDGFRVFARVALNTLRGGSAVELVARAMEASSNPECDPDRAIPASSGHYMMGMPYWCMWVEYAKPAVELIASRRKEMPFTFEKVLGSVYDIVHRQRPMTMDEVTKALETRAATREETLKEKLDWQTNVTDLLKLMDLDPDFQARRRLAEELGFHGTFIGSAEQNRALHKLVMAEIAKRCTKTPI